MEKNSKKIWLVRTYCIISFLIICIPLVIVFTRTGTGSSTYENVYTDISDEWYLEEGEEKVSCADFGKIMDPEKGKISIYYKLPADMKDTSIMYHSKDVFTKVYYEDELLYETEYYDSPLYNKSPGNMWNVVKLDDELAGKCIRMDIEMVYDTKSVCVDNIRMGDKMNILIGYAMSKNIGILVSLAMIVIGFTLGIINIYTLFDKTIPKTGNFSLAAFAINIGMWCFVETNVLQVYMDDGRLLQLVDNMCMFIGLLPMVFYLDSFYGLLKHRVVRIVCWVDVMILTLCFVTQVTDIADFHKWIMLAWIMFGVCAAIMVIYSGYKLYHKIREKKLEVAHVMHIVGFVCLVLAGVGPGAKYMNTDTLDRAEQIRFGVFIFILCSAIGTQIQNSKRMSKAIKYDLVRNLAYQDGLTGLNNRTSYLEQIKNYEENKINKLGIVFLDINNLKKINDNYGHNYGDNYITAAANVIEDSFGTYGHAYRIGGDEFCVFIEGIDIQTAYINAKKRFEELRELKRESSKLIKDVELEIAHGFEIYTSGKGKSLEDVIKEADEKMYANKAELKAL